MTTTLARATYSRMSGTKPVTITRSPARAFHVWGGFDQRLELHVGHMLADEWKNLVVKINSGIRLGAN